MTEDDGVLYVKLHHIKSISKTGSPEDKKKDQKTSKNPVFSKASYFSSIFKELEHKWVAINRGGPEAMEGILVKNQVTIIRLLIIKQYSVFIHTIFVA